MGSMKVIQIRNHVAECINELADTLQHAAGELLDIAQTVEGNQEGLSGILRHRDYLYLLAAIQNMRLDVLDWEKSANFVQPLRNRGITEIHKRNIEQTHNELSRLFSQG